MALVGLSLILASVVWVAVRRPPLVQTLLALWRGHPQIQQPPSTQPPPAQSRPEASQSPDPEDAGDTSGSTPQLQVQSPPSDQAPAPAISADRAAMPPPPRPAASTAAAPTPLAPASPSARDRDPGELVAAAESEETTPKAAGAPTLPPQLPALIPSLSLAGDEPPASAAAAARLAPAAPSTSNLMPPPPRPMPRAGNAGQSSTGSSSLLAPPPSGARRPQSSLSPTPNRGRPVFGAQQAGSSTLPPPPAGSAAASRKKVGLSPGHSPLDWARLVGSGADLTGLPPGVSMVNVTPSELRQHNGRHGSDVWMALDGRVYNVSAYVPFHPGGVDELMAGAGRDATRQFYRAHHFVAHSEMLRTCLVGKLVREGEGGEIPSEDMEAMD